MYPNSYNNTYMPAYNPPMTPQQRLNMMEQQYSQFPQNMNNVPINQNNMNVNMGLKGRAVTNYEEARAAMIDFDGSLFIFPDVSNKKIYTKRINLDGSSELLTYVLVPNNVPQPTPVNYPINVDNNNLELEQLKTEINQLRAELEELKGGIQYVQSNTDNADVQSVKKQSKSNGVNATANGK